MQPYIKKIHAKKDLVILPHFTEHNWINCPVYPAISLLLYVRKPRKPSCSSGNQFSTRHGAWKGTILDYILIFILEVLFWIFFNVHIKGVEMRACTTVCTYMHAHFSIDDPLHIYLKNSENYFPNRKNIYRF